MIRTGRLVVAVALFGAAASWGVSTLAGASGPDSPGAPRWVMHVRNYSGGISNGVRAELEAADSPSATPKAAAQAPTDTADPAVGPRSGNIQINDDSYPPMPQNETAVAINASNERIAVAAANDYVSGGVVVMRTTDGGHTWRSTRITPQYHHAGDPFSNNF
jgi:hypothetical protein